MRPAVAQDGNARVVVVGGGFGGAACARALKRANPRMAVTLVETNRTFTACPMSNAAIAGLRDLKLKVMSSLRVGARYLEPVTPPATLHEVRQRVVMRAQNAILAAQRTVDAAMLEHAIELLVAHAALRAGEQG